MASYGQMANQTDIAMIFMSIGIGTFNMLKESIDIPYRAFINISTSSVYGKRLEPMREDNLPLPDTFYAASKLGAEYLCRAFVKQYDKPIVNVRPFSVYGIGEANFRFIPTVIRNMGENKAFPLDSTAVHDWVNIKDFINALNLICEKSNALSGKVINIGSGAQRTNKEVCEMLKKISGKEYLATQIEGMRRNDSEVWIADNSYLRAFGWFPQIMLEDGLRECWEYYTKKYEIR